MAAIKLNKISGFDLNNTVIKDKITLKSFLSVHYNNEEENEFVTQNEDDEDQKGSDIIKEEEEFKEEENGEVIEQVRKESQGGKIPKNWMNSIGKKRESSILKSFRDEKVLGVFTRIVNVPSSIIKEVKEKIEDQKRVTLQQKLIRKRTVPEESIIISKSSITVKNIWPLLGMLFMIASTVIGFLLNILGIINMIIISYMTLRDVKEEYVHIFMIIELVVGIYYIIENIADIYTAESWLEQLLSPKTLADIFIIIEIFWQYLELNRNWVIICFRALRSIKIKKIRSIFNTCVKTIKKYIYREHTEKLERETGNEIAALVVNSMLDLIMWIFIEATFILALNEVLDFKAFNPFENKEDLDYLTAMYYVIVSLMTIGYGDISPKRTETRLFITLTLLTNIVILSDFLGTFTEMLINLSPYIKKYNLHDHIIILGDLPFTFLEILLEEILLVDKIHNKLPDSKSKKKKKKKKI